MRTSVSRQSRSKTSMSPYWRFIQRSIQGLRWRAANAKSGNPYLAIDQAAMYQFPECGTMMTTPLPSST